VAVVYVQEFAVEDGSWSTANYDWAKKQIGDDPIDGLIVHTAGFDKDAGVFRIMDVWESQEHGKRFIAERVQPLIYQGRDALPDPENATPPTREVFYELHDVRK
jgi:hypothetical protein